MSYAKGNYKRSNLEKTFIVFFLPAVIFGYLLLKFPKLFVDSIESLYFLGKHPSFWYSTLYTFIVSYIAIKVLLRGTSPYKKGKKPPLSGYQKKKFLAIFVVQFGLLYLFPFFILPLIKGLPLFDDPVSGPKRDAYVYVSRAFHSWGGIIYTFVLVPLSVWFFGKKYCSWFCACGNLAETVGVTKWGASWVKYFTPTGKTAKKLEHMQTFFLIIGLAYGILIFFDFLKIFTAQTSLETLKFYQDLVVDLIFGSIIGIGAYPFFGTRVWCRYGCPLAKMMELQGKYFGSKFKVAADDKCKGLNLCSQVCPMGIDVASYAHKDKIPTLGSFSLKDEPCIGCGGCVDICPVDALTIN